MSKEVHYCWPIGNEFKGTPGSMGTEEQQYFDKTISAFKSGKYIVFEEFIHKSQWEYFIKQTKGIEGDIELAGPLPDGWTVDNKKRIKVWNRSTAEALKYLYNTKKQFPFLGYKRDVKSLDKHFLLTYGSKNEVERERVVQVLERLKVLDHSTYSRPNVTEDCQKHVNLDCIFPIDNKNPKYRNIEGTDEVLGKGEYLYNNSKAVPVLYQAAKKVHCWAVLDCLPFNDNVAGGNPSEKWVWPVFMGIPWIYIGSTYSIEILRSWGFEPNETFRSDIRSVAEQMMWLKSIFNDTELAQKWQENQGTLIIKNREALDRLLEIIGPPPDSRQ